MSASYNRNSNDVKLLRMETKAKKTMLIGNSFPFTLIRREVNVVPVSLEDVRSRQAVSEVYSYWGHEGTVEVASNLLGVNMRPKSERPAIVLSKDGYPTLDGVEFRACYVCSPNYATGFRPKIGEDVTADKIVGWQTLKMTWL